MAARVVIFVFLLICSSQSCFAALEATIPPDWAPDAPVICTWGTFGKYLECDGQTFVYEAQDTVGSATWWLDLGLVFCLIIFAGMRSFLQYNCEHLH